MTRILIALLFVPVVLVPLAAGAAERGLDMIEITPAQPPEDPGAVVRMLEDRPGSASAAWDAERGVFTVAVEESASVSTRDLREDLIAQGLEPAVMDFYFETVNAEVSNMGYLVAKENGFRLPVKWTVHGQRFWAFHGGNPRGLDADFRVQARILPGAIDSTGAAAPDTANIIHFELTVPAYVEKNR